MRQLEERQIDAGGVTTRPAAKRGRSVTVNVAESPLAWLASRGLVDARQVEAGERLRADYETAALGARVTMRWAPRVDGGGTALDPGTAQLAARRRFDAALAALGSGLADVAWRVICAGEALPIAEKALGWPTRSGRLVLTFALDRLAAHYRLP
jgi:glutathione S-transferase